MLSSIALSLAFVLQRAEAAQGAGPNTSADSSSSNVVAMLVLGEMDSGLVQTVSTWLKENIEPKPVIVKRDGTVTDGASIHSVLTAATECRKRDVICVLVLARSAQAVSIKNASMVTNSIAVVYPDALRPQNGKSDVFAHRVETESLKAVMLAVGLPVCPFPLCAMSDFADEAELDGKSRNLCPPCHEKMKRLLRKQIGSGR